MYNPVEHITIEPERPIKDYNILLYRLIKGTKKNSLGSIMISFQIHLNDLILLLFGNQ